MHTTRTCRIIYLRLLLPYPFIGRFFNHPLHSRGLFIRGAERPGEIVEAGLIGGSFIRGAERLGEIVEAGLIGEIVGAGLLGEIVGAGLLGEIVGAGLLGEIVGAGLLGASLTLDCLVSVVREEFEVLVERTAR